MGTRFRLFVQPPFSDAEAQPETVEVSSPAGSIGAGPSDARMHVVEPEGKRLPYGLNHGPFGTPFLYLPPWHGPVFAPAVPDARGHFDRYAPDQPEFLAAHAFGCIRFTLDVWERHIGRPLEWHFGDHYERLEISILPDWDNAQYGYGFLELGSQVDIDRRVLPFSLDFDVIAHEVGHAILYSLLGVPGRGRERPEYIGFQEAFADCVSLIAAMHFPSVIDAVLEETRGNLHRANRIARFSELSSTRQIRNANNQLTMADFVEGFRDEHALSQPLTGAVFDILVDIFHESLVRRGIIPRDLETLADFAELDPSAADLVDRGFEAAYHRSGAGMREALLDAREFMASVLAGSLRRLAPDDLGYADVAEALIGEERLRTGGMFSDLFGYNLERRGFFQVRAGPRLPKTAPGHHTEYSRIALPEDRAWLPQPSFREVAAARTLQSCHHHSFGSGG